MQLDVGALTEKRNELGVAEADVRKALNLQLGPYRRMMREQRAIRLDELMRLSKVIRLNPLSLMCNRRS